MKKTIYVLTLLLIVMSCSQDESISIQEIKEANLISSINKEAFDNALLKKYNVDKKIYNNSTSKGAKFIEPFYTEGEGFGVTWFNFPYIGYAFFSADYGKGDFYRENNDGTISVHVNSNKAFVFYREFSLLDEEDQYTLSGYPGHLSVNFTAEHVVEDIFDPETGEYLFTINYLDIFNSKRGVSIRGKGKVANETTGEEHTVTLTMSNTPSGKRNVHVSLK